MSFRGALMAVLAGALVSLTTGCADNVKAERDNLLAQNQQFKASNEDLSNRLKATESELAIARSTPSTPSTPAESTGPAVPGMGEGTGDVGTAKGDVLSGSGVTRGRSRSGETQFEIGSDVLFDSGRSSLKPEAKRALDKLVTVLKAQYKTSKLRVEGHTDSSKFKAGVNMTNDKLGMNRAKSVVEYLVAHGISSSRLTAVSMADKEPKSKTNPALNRRVNVVIAK